MKWSSIKWILFGSIIIVGVYLYYRYTTKEGFVTISNIEYPFKEVFLVAPTNVSEKGNPVSLYSVPSMTQYKNQGYKWDEARAVCRAYKGDLATVEQVQKAYDNSGNWCPVGWTLDGGTDRAYYLPTKTYPCQLSPTAIPAQISSVTLPTETNGNRYAFAICYGVKPPQPTTSVTPFNSSRYSIIDPSSLSKVMGGDGSDIFPVAFTVSQANYAIDKQGTTNNRFDFKKAREWLITNYENLDATILASEPMYTDNPNKWDTLTKVNNESCILVKEKDDDVSNKLLRLQAAFRDVSGSVIAAVKSKRENSKIQAMLYNICAGTNPSDSPACAKLATLDFDLFYTSLTQNTLADLEVLNSQIYKRREEVCAILHNIRVIKSTLSCPYTALAPECSQGCATSGAYDCSNATIFDINAIGALRYSLEELSPLFDRPEYNDILKSVMEKLSYIVETPSLANFDMSYKNMELIVTVLREIQELVESNRAG